MHFHFDFSATQILWTLTFAAELVLLVVLLGRDRARRFPWFTVNIIVMALLLLISKLLLNRIAPMTATTIFLSISVVAAITGLLVSIEVARRAFEGASARAWTIGAILMLAIVGVVLWRWGPWPAWKTFADHSQLGVLRTMQMAGDKGSILYEILDIEIAIAIFLFGRRFRAGWRSHPQMIAIGLSTVAIAQLAVRITWQLIATHTTIHSREQYERFMALRDRMYHGNNVVYICALVWWISWLWLDEPGTPVAAATLPEDSAAAAEGA